MRAPVLFTPVPASSNKDEKLGTREGIPAKLRLTPHYKQLDVLCISLEEASTGVKESLWFS